jgi:hypothetical protein
MSPPPIHLTAIGPASYARVPRGLVLLLKLQFCYTSQGSSYHKYLWYVLIPYSAQSAIPSKGSSGLGSVIEQRNWYDYYNMHSNVISLVLITKSWPTITAYSPLAGPAAESPEACVPAALSMAVDVTMPSKKRQTSIETRKMFVVPSGGKQLVQ